MKHTTETAQQHDWRDQPGGRAPRCARCNVVTFDAPWEFAVTWDPASGMLPGPIQRLFRHRSTISHASGRAVHQTDKGHSTHYAEAVAKYVSKYHPDRTDIVAAASEMPCPPGQAGE